MPVFENGSSPIVSVLMPVGGERAFLRDAASSVLQQTLSDLELIIIDDAGRPDEAARLAGADSDPRIRVVTNPGKGICDALNAGIAMARGNYLARCDADDRYPPDRLARHVAFLESDGHFGAVCGGVHAMDHHGRFITDLHAGQAAEEISDELRQGKTRCGLWAFTIRRKWFIPQEGGEAFRRFFITAEDIDFTLRLAERTRVWFDGQLAYYYRLSNDSITHRQPTAARVFYEQSAKKFAEQRRIRGQDDLQLGRPPSPPALTDAPTTAGQIAQSMLIGAAWRQHRGGHKARAAMYAFRACWMRPMRIANWRSLTAILIKKTGNSQ